MSNITLEIIDLENTSGNPALTRIYGEGFARQNAGNIFFALNTASRNQSERASVPLVARGLGPSLTGQPVPKRFSNPILFATVNGEQETNNDWTGYSLKNVISGYNLNPPSGVESVLLTHPNPDTTINYYSLYETTTGELSSAYGKRGAIDLRRVYQKEFLEYEQLSSGLSNAWLSYDVSSGMSNQSTFSYSLEILDSISGLEGIEVNPVVTGGTSMVGYSGYKVQGGNCFNVSLLLENTGITCQVDAGSDVPEFDVCITGTPTPAVLQSQIRSILSGLTQSEKKKGVFQGDAIDNSEVITDSISIEYVVYKGILKYNQPYSGDYICFKSYNFDYTGQYQSYYQTDPPYPIIDKCFVYGQDYTGIDSLIDAINFSLSGSGESQQLWIKDICNDETLSGYFETGGLLKAYKLSDNEIAIESLRLGKAGEYEFSFHEVSRPFTTESVNTLKYLRPEKITIQGANSYGVWTDLNVQSGIKWDDITPREIFGHLNIAVTGFATGSGGNSLPSSPQPTGASGKLARTPLADYTISGYDKCGGYFEKPVHFFALPSGFECGDTGELGDGSSSNVNGGDSNTPLSSGFDIKYNMLKTGWKFKNETPYNYYRLVFDNLKAGGKGKKQKLHDEFLISNINFYGVQSGSQIHSGETCILGGIYNGQYMGYTTGSLTGELTGFANESGELVYNHLRVVGVPNGNGSVLFNGHIGTATEQFTGIVTTVKTGIGFFTDTVQGNFYNSIGECVYFEVPVSGTVTGQGLISGGPYNIINDSAWSGIKNIATVHVTGENTGLFTGIILNFSYIFGGVPCVGVLTGQITGEVLSGDLGYYNLSTPIAGVPISGHSLSVSGTVQASAVLHYNIPQIGDAVFINDTVIIYNPESGNLPPTYFSSISELNGIINSGASLFGMTGTNNGSNIYLKALSLGISGNGISLSATGSSTAPSFNSLESTGGKNFYYPITPTGQFTGQLDLKIAATGNYTGLATGNLTGNIKQLDFIRYFSGIWNISSGDIDFRESGWISGGNSYQNSGFSSLGTYSGHPDILPLLVTYVNDPLVYSTDLARLTVFGYGMNSGLSMVLSGQY